MSAQDNIETMRRLYTEVFSGGDYAVVDELVATGFVEHQSGVEGRGPEAVRRIARSLRESFPDLRLEIEDAAAVADKVWMRCRGRGTDTGGVAGRPPTGRTIVVDVIDVVRFADGKMVEHWGVADRLGMLEQVGALPTPVRRAA